MSPMLTMWGVDAATALAIDRAGNRYVAGTTTSPNVMFAGTAKGILKSLDNGKAPQFRI